MDFTSLAVLLVGAGICAIIAKLLRQPLLVGYLLAGFLFASFGLVHDFESFRPLAELGVMLLLFLLGLEMKLDELPKIGKTAFVTGIGQIVITSFFGFLLAIWLGFSYLPALYLAIALSFSSTIIIVKLLAEKRDLQSLYGRISIGFLLVQDFVAIFLLIFLSGLQSNGLQFSSFFIISAKAISLFVFVWYASKTLVPFFVTRYLSSPPELLFIVSIAWALGFAAFVAGPFGLTIEIGGFLAGLALSNLPEHLQIASRARPLRDFFLTIFFALLGTELVLGKGLGEILIPGLIFSFFVLLINPLIALSILGFMGYKRRTSFLAGLSVAQISEFSLILLAMGLSLNHVTQKEVSLTVLVGAITMTVSTYMILSSEKLYQFFHPYLKIFERKQLIEGEEVPKLNMNNHIVLIGSDRTGSLIVDYIRKKTDQYLVIEFNPLVVEKLEALGVPVLFGDSSDEEILDAANVSHAALIIATHANHLDNLVLLEYLKNTSSHAITLFSSQTNEEARMLYKKGADYVYVANATGGAYVAMLLRSFFRDKKQFKKRLERRDIQSSFMYNLKNAHV